MMALPTTEQKCQPCQTTNRLADLSITISLKIIPWRWSCTVRPMSYKNTLDMSKTQNRALILLPPLLRWHLYMRVIRVGTATTLTLTSFNPIPRRTNPLLITRKCSFYTTITK